MQSNFQSSGEDIDLRELFSMAWKGRRLVVGITAAVTTVSILVVFLLANIYRAEAVLISAEDEQSRGNLAGQYGGAAALLGINIGSGSVDRVNTAIAVMNSREFIGQFIDKHELLVPLFAGTWDSANGASGIDSSIYDEANDSWLRNEGRPTRLEAYREFSAILNVSGPSRDTGVVTVSIDWHDPRLASHWVNQFVADINNAIKQHDVEEATSAIEYLGEQLETTQLVEMQRVFYQLIEAQTRVIMLADVRDEYVFRTIDPAVVPDRKIAPRRALIVGMSALSGLLLGVLALIVIRVFRSGSTRP